MVNRYLLFSRLFDKTLFIYLTISLQPIPLAKQVLCYYKQKRGAETLKIYNFLKKEVLFLPHAYPFNLNSGKKLDTHTHTHVLCVLYHVQLFATPWTVAHHAPLSVECSRQGYWSGLPFPSPGYLPNTGIEPISPAFAGRFFTTEPPGKPH